MMRKFSPGIKGVAGGPVETKLVIFVFLSCRRKVEEAQEATSGIMRERRSKGHSQLATHACDPF